MKIISLQVKTVIVQCYISQKLSLYLDSLGTTEIIVFNFVPLEFTRTSVSIYNLN